MPGSFLQTKFYIPPQRPNLVSRHHLLAKLDAGLGYDRLFTRRLTLISAPAGFGKTTLVTNWLNHLAQSEQGADILPGWLSLDVNDNEKRRFITYLIAAFQAIELQSGEVFGKELLAALQSSRAPDEAAILPAFLNELATIEQPLLLVLDDYHVITETGIHEWLAQLIEYLPPQIHFVITSREDPPLPLARWRVRGQLTEIRAADLRFSAGEAADFLHRTMGLSLDEDLVDQLESRTEGWVAALQLAAIALQSPSTIEAEVDVGQLVADFSGSDRHVADYLLEEVLHRQSQEEQAFLLETAVMERFNAAVCDRLTGRSDGREMLDNLNRRNLFVIPLDNRGKWFRYHHLFAQLLRHRLERLETAEKLAERHRQARQWFLEQDLMEEAVYHALQAGDAVWVAEYLCGLDPIRLWEGTMAMLFKGWLGQLTAEVIERYPRLMMSAVWAYLLTTDVKQAQNYLSRLNKLPYLDETLQAELFIIKAIMVRGQGENETAREYVSKALKVLPEDQELIRMIAFMQMASVSFNVGDLDKALDISRFVYDTVETRTTAGLNMYLNAAQLLSIALRNQIQFYQAMNMLQHTLEVVSQNGNGFIPMVGLIYVEMGRIYYEWNELDKAGEYCQRTIELGLRTGISDLLLSSYLLDAQLARREGDLKRLGERLKWFKAVTHRADMREMIRVANYLEAAFRLDMGDLDSAVRWANASGLHLDDEPTYLHFGHYHTLARIYLVQGSQSSPNQEALLERVGGLIERLIIVIEAANDRYSLVELLILKAILLKTQGRLKAGTAVMAEAIQLAEAGTLVRTFLDNGPAVYSLIQEVSLAGMAETAELSAYIQQLLKACDAEWGVLPDRQAEALVQPLVDPLTEREREVLTCIMAGLTNREIEERLVISHNTVRTHIKNLYSKLGVSSREEALEQAQLLGFH